MTHIRSIKSTMSITILSIFVLLQGCALNGMPEGITMGTVRGWSDCYLISNGQVTATICPQVGGRILQYQLGKDRVFAEQRKFDGKILAPKEKPFHPGGYQLDVIPFVSRETPGYSELKAGPWAVEVLGPYQLRLSSSPTSPLGFHLTKTLTMDPKTGALTVDQTITNHSKSPIRFGLWDRTWTSGADYVFFPIRKKGQFKAGWDFTDNSKRWRDIPKIMKSDQFLEHDGLFIIDGKRNLHNAQMVAECPAGWMAWVKDNLLYVKRFAYEPKAAYGFDGGNVSIFNGGTKLPIIEIEPTGPIQTIPPGESSTFRIVWELRQLKQPVRKVDDLRKTVEGD
jgi:hypothetical protein